MFSQQSSYDLQSLFPSIPLIPYPLQSKIDQLEYNMSIFFANSQASEGQNTAFFQAGEASKASIFDDNPSHSQSQLAYELFNSQPSPTHPAPQDRSLITQLELLDRREDFAQTPLHPQKPPSKREQHLESQESKDSRMTFGGKPFNNKLRSSLVEEPLKYEERAPPSKPKPLATNRQKPSQPSSSFSLTRACPPVREPDSMPVKFEGPKPIAKAIYQLPSNSSSSFSIDFEELKQKNQMDAIKPLARQITSLRINNERETNAGRSECGRSEKTSQPSQDGSKSREQKERKFGFNLRRSKVSQDNRDKDANKDNRSMQNGFSIRNALPTASNPQSITNNTSNILNIQPKTDAKIAKQDQRPANTDEGLITPFKPRPKQATEKSLATSIVKKVEPEQKTPVFNRYPQQQKPQPKILLQAKTSDKQSKRLIEIRPTEAKVAIDDANERQPSEQSKKRQSIGLKEQLKKLTSRPTEKIQIKSIAFNKGFKLKPKSTENLQAKQEQPHFTKENTSTGPTSTSSSFTVQKSNQSDHRHPTNRPFLAMKEERNQHPTPKVSKSSDFSKYMLALMELQQESESLKAKTEHSRNSYREMAILNNDINRRIELLLREPPKK